MSLDARSGDVLRTEDFQRALTDKKEYRLLTLENGLEVLLVADKNSAKKADDDDSEDEDVSEDDDDETGSIASEEQLSVPSEVSSHEHGNHHMRGVGGCAVAMAVGVGSFDEKAGHEPHGLAHLLEHMLFMGSKKYPTENAYDDHLSKFGGYSNAYTEAECTVYYFEVSQPGLHPALDIFAQFFISPLMLKDSLNREINAVDSEFDTVRGDDELRVKAIWRLGTVSQEHPYARFCWGNTTSLTALNDKRDLREMLQEFYQNHYHVDNMKLVVWSPEELDTMEPVVRQSFSGIPKAAHATRIVPKSSEMPFSESTCLSFVHKIVPVTDCHNLRLTWQHIPLASYRSRPAAYVAHLLGHESGGGVLAYLKRMSWATDFWAGMSEDDGHDNSTVCSLFSVDVKLTVAGVENFPKVIAAVFAYLGMIKNAGPQRWVFDELQKTTQAAFDYKDEGDPSSEVCDLAVNMLPMSKITNRKELLVADNLLFDFNEKDIDDLLTSLGPVGKYAPRIDLASALFGRECYFAARESGSSKEAEADEDGVPKIVFATPPSKEEYWQTRFWKEPLDNETKRMLVDAMEKGSLFDPQMKLALPPRNQYIPTALQIIPLSPSRLKRDAERALHPLVGASVEIHTQIGKKWSWLPAQIEKARVVQRDANATTVELLAEFELDEKPQVLRPVVQDESSPSAIAGPLFMFNEGRTKVRVIRPSLPLHPDPIGPLGSAPVRLWWLQDGIFRVPRSGMFVVLRCPSIQSSPTRRSLADLVACLAQHELDHEAYLAKMAELEIHLKVHDEGFVLTVMGFSEKLLELMEKGVRTLFKYISFSFDLSSTREAIELEREALIRQLVNAEIETDVQANNWRLRAIIPGSFSKHQLAEELRKPINQLFNATESFWTSDSRLEALYHGNVDQAEAERARTMLKNIVSPYVSKKAKSSQVFAKPLKRPAVVKIPQGTLSAFVVPSDESTEKTHAMHLYYEMCDDSPQNQAVAEVMESLMDEPLFDELRTKQQLGYIVSCGLRRTHGVLGFAVEITSSKFSPIECLRRFESFLDKFREEELEDMPESELKKRSESLARRILQKDTGIFQETKRHWNPIFEQTYRFNEKWITAHHIVNIPKTNGRFGVSLKEVKDFFDNHLRRATRRCLLVMVVGGGNPEVADLAKEKSEAGAMGATLFEDPKQFWERYPERFDEDGNTVLAGDSGNGATTKRKSKKKQSS